MPKSVDSTKIAEGYKSLLGTPLGRDISQHLQDENIVFVFPSQDTADSWARAVVYSEISRAVALNRFLGFDNFLLYVAKANEQDDLSVLKPIHRWIWAMQILSKEQKGERKPGKRLSTLLPSMEISTKNLTRLVRLAPYLFEIEMLTKDSAVLDASPCRFIKEEFEEMRLLAEDYIDFLDRARLRDSHRRPLVLPPFMKVRAYGLRDDFIRFGLIDSEELGDGNINFRGILGEETGHEKSLSAKERIAFPDIFTQERGEKAPMLYHQFNSSLVEIEWILEEISNEIEQGIEPEDIAISVCGLTAKKEAWIRQIAAEYGVPVSIRRGKPLSMSPFGRVLMAIQNAAREGLTLESLDAFADLANITGRDPEAWKALRDTALSLRLPSPSPSAAYIHSLWKGAFGTGQCPESTAQIYQRLWESILSIARADSFSRLYDQIIGFLERWIDTSGFGANIQTDRSMRLTLDELQSWIDHENIFTDLSIPPFELFLTVLESKSYIPLVEENAVYIYDFDTTAGIAVLSHYVAGASQEGLASSLKIKSALPPELAGILQQEKTDKAHEVINMHRVSPTQFSFAAKGFEDYETAYPLFPLAIMIDPNAERGLRAILISKEQKSATESYSHPEPIEPTVARSFLNATKSFDSEKKYAIFSPSSLKELSQCGFRWFASKIDLVDVYSRDDSAIAIGNLYHSAYRRAIQALPQNFKNAETDEEFRKTINSALSKEAKRILLEYGNGLQPILSALFPRAIHRLNELWNFERTMFSAYEREGFEMRLQHEFSEEEAILEGRIDCLFSRQDESLGNIKCYVIVDYKKNRIPSISKMRVGVMPSDYEELASYDENQEKEDGYDSSAFFLEEIQVPSYTLLVETSWGRVEGAFYWSIEKAEAVGYIRPPTVPKMRSAYAYSKETDFQRSALRDMLRVASSKVKAGNFLDLALDRAVCEDCEFKPLCRFWYFLEL
ncbi:MAG TPA: PD-(D/E)XK nuclease family protein [Rectinema sp.]|nr:PD-(D/E)XK nuclease family protein [Rectinema sp.]